MPSVNIVRQTDIVESFRVQQIRGMFDYNNKTIKHEWQSNLPIEGKEWSIGLIVGPSGSGKTTLAKEAFKHLHLHESFDWSHDKAVVDCFDKDLSIKEITSMLNAVGFSSVPHWFKPFSHLSNGQKFRVELARCLLLKGNGIVFDEFTSVVDRDVAKIGCAAISKCLRRKGSPPFVAVSCHYDIIDWLDPDWVFDVGSQTFDWRERRRFPEIKLDIYETTNEAWQLFREHHYLDHSFNKAAKSFIALLDDKPVAFCSVLHFPHPSSKYLKREHRTVVFPDFQGIGIGNKISEFVAKHYKSKGFRFLSTTSAPAMIHYRNKSKKWKMHRFGRVSMPSTGIQAKDKSISVKRITGGFEFVG